MQGLHLYSQIHPSAAGWFHIQGEGVPCEDDRMKTGLIGDDVAVIISSHMNEQKWVWIGGTNRTQMHISISVAWLWTFIYDSGKVMRKTEYMVRDRKNPRATYLKHLHVDIVC